MEKKIKVYLTLDQDSVLEIKEKCGICWPGKYWIKQLSDPITCIVPNWATLNKQQYEIFVISTRHRIEALRVNYVAYGKVVMDPDFIETKDIDEDIKIEIKKLYREYEKDYIILSGQSRALAFLRISE